MFQQSHRRRYIKVFLFALIGLFGVVGQTWALSFAYVANHDSDNVSAYTIANGTGVLTPVAGSPFAAGSTPHSVIVTVSPDPAPSPAAVSIPTLSPLGFILLALALIMVVAVRRRRHSS